MFEMTGQLEEAFHDEEVLLSDLSLRTGVSLTSLTIEATSCDIRSPMLIEVIT
jgi:hypothetical protein